MAPNFRGRFDGGWLVTVGALFLGPAGHLGAVAVEAALRAGTNGKAALLYGRIASLNGKPFWELRRHLSPLLGVSTRQITRYFRQLVDVGLLVNKPAPLDAIPPGASRKLMFRPWFKWPIGLPELREVVRAGSKESYERWREKFEKSRESRVTRSKLGEIIGSIVSRRSATPPRPPEPGPPRKTWTVEEIDAELAKRPRETPAETPWTGSRGPPE